MSDQASAALLHDEFTGQPGKRALAYVQGRREEGRPIIGTYGKQIRTRVEALFETL